MNGIDLARSSGERYAALTLRQERFVHEYLIDQNAGAAYGRAGYVARGNAAYASASRLLRNAKVASAIQQHSKRLCGDLKIRQQQVLREVARIAFSNIADLFDEHGNLCSVAEIPADVSAAIKTLQVRQTCSRNRSVRAFTIGMYDKVAALRLLMEHLGLL